MIDVDFYTDIDFEFNSHWEVTIQPYNNSYILFIDNIYKNPLKLFDYLQKVPIVSHKPHTKNSLIGQTFIDGQHTLHPDLYCNDKHRRLLIAKICDFYNLDLSKIIPQIHINQFRLLKDYPGHEFNWTCHTDCQLNVLIFLNPQENMTAGTSFYKAKQEDSLKQLNHEHEQPWINDSLFKEQLCILSKFNSLVAFPGQWPHGQKIIDNRYKEKTRFTEVTFL